MAGDGGALASAGSIPARPRMHMTDQQRDKYIRALLEERRQAEALGNRDTVNAIANELSRLGADAAPAAKRAAKRPAPKRDTRRSEE